MNPVEEFWRHLKDALNYYFATDLSDVKRAIRQSFTKITTLNMANYLCCSKWLWCQQWWVNTSMGKAHRLGFQFHQYILKLGVSPIASTCCFSIGSNSD